MNNLTPLHSDVTPDPIHELPQQTPPSTQPSPLSTASLQANQEHQATPVRRFNLISPLFFGVGIFFIGIGFWFKSTQDTAGIGELLFALSSFFGGLLCFFGLIFLFTRGKSYHKKLDEEERMTRQLDTAGLQQRSSRILRTILVLVVVCLLINFLPKIGMLIAPENDFVSLMWSLRLVGIIATIIIAAIILNAFVKLYKITVLLRSLQKSKE